MIQAILEALADPPLKVQVIVVDDNSPDGTAEAIREAFSGSDAVRLIVQRKRAGFGHGYRQGDFYGRYGTHRGHGYGF